MASILTIMLTTSSCQPHHHQVVGKCNSSGTPELRLEKTLGRETLCFFSGKVASVSRVSVSAGAGLDLQKLSTKRAQDSSAQN